MKNLSKSALEKLIDENKNKLKVVAGTLYSELVKMENQLLRDELMTRK